MLYWFLAFLTFSLYISNNVDTINNHVYNILIYYENNRQAVNLTSQLRWQGKRDDKATLE